MAFTTIELERRGPALWLTLNRPEVMNAFEPHMVEEIDDALDLVEFGRERARAGDHGARAGVLRWRRHRVRPALGQR